MFIRIQNRIIKKENILVITYDDEAGTLSIDYKDICLPLYFFNISENDFNSLLDILK